MIQSVPVSSLKCYRCGTLTPSSGPGLPESGQEAVIDTNPAPGYRNLYELESCDEFKRAETPSYLYVVECGGDPSAPAGKELCAKIGTYTYEEAPDGNGEQRRTLTFQRGCVKPSTSIGLRHQIGCGLLHEPLPNEVINITESEHICFCDTNYCNLAPAQSSPVLIMTIISFTLTLYLFMFSL